VSPLTTDLANQTAVVTGAASGIGAAIAEMLAVAGARTAVADLDLDAARDRAESIAARGGEALPFHVDVTSRESADKLRSDIEPELGSASILVNNAGWGQPQLFTDNSEDFWEKLVAINFMGTLHVTRAFLDPMIAAGAGRIVNVASDAGRVGSTGETVYAGTKGGVIAFTKSLAREVARHGINVNCVCPGPTDTPFFAKHEERMQQALIRAIPFRRLAQPDEIAGAVTFFASDQAAFITGQVLSVSGGLTMAG
jgi:2-hydroxycyclohexanecarboxyl-CoA dehydrogenase